MDKDILRRILLGVLAATAELTGKVSAVVKIGLEPEAFDKTSVISGEGITFLEDPTGTEIIVDHALGKVVFFKLRDENPESSLPDLEDYKNQAGGSMKEKFTLTESQVEFIASEHLMDEAGKHEKEAWRILGITLGFDPKTIKSINSLREFYAEPAKSKPEPSIPDLEDYKDQIGGPGS